MSGFWSDAVEVLRPATKTNRAGETTLDYAALEAAIRAGTAVGATRGQVRVRAQNTTEVVDVDRTTTVTTWRIATKPWSGDWDVLATDWLRLSTGEVLAVDGELLRGYDPVSGNLHHLELNARKAMG